MEPEIVIIGAGPAGLAAAIQLQRYGLAPVVIERDRVGGLLHSANLVENYPGFPTGISGPALAARFDKHVSATGIVVVDDEVVSLAREENAVAIATAAGRQYRGLAIIASGTEPIPHPTISVPRSVADRVGYDVTRLANVTDGHIAIIGGSDAAFDYALNLARRNRVTILHRAPKPTALSLLHTRAQAEPSLSIQPLTEVRAVAELANGTLQLSLTGPPDEATLACDYLLIAIGRRPCLGFMPEGAHGTNKGQASPIYYAGDVVNGHARQTAIAVGDGLRAAMHIAEQIATWNATAAVPR